MQRKVNEMQFKYGSVASEAIAEIETFKLRKERELRETKDRVEREYLNEEKKIRQEYEKDMVE